MKSTLSPDVRRLIDEKVSGGGYRSADEVVRRGLTLLEQEERRRGAARAEGAGDLGGAFAGIAREVPDDEWERVPADLSRNPDRYLYGERESS